MSDVDCPYCGKPQEINHDDGYGLDEFKIYSQQCGDMTFAYTTAICIYHEAKQADCLNDGEHEWEKQFSYKGEDVRRENFRVCGEQQRVPD